MAKWWLFSQAVIRKGGNDYMNVFLTVCVTSILPLYSGSLPYGLTSVHHAKKVVSDSPGIVDFAIGLENSVFNLLDGQVMFFEEFE